MIPMEWMQLIQTASIVIAMLVALGTLRGRGDDRAVILAKMQSDIEHIKKTVDGFDDIRDQVTEVKSAAKSAHKRLDDHLKYDHNLQMDRRE